MSVSLQLCQDFLLPPSRVCKCIHGTDSTRCLSSPYCPHLVFASVSTAQTPHAVCCLSTAPILCLQVYPRHRLHTLSVVSLLPPSRVCKCFHGTDSTRYLLSLYCSHLVFASVSTAQAPHAVCCLPTAPILCLQVYPRHRLHTLSDVSLLPPSRVCKCIHGTDSTRCLLSPYCPHLVFASVSTAQTPHAVCCLSTAPISCSQVYPRHRLHTLSFVSLLLPSRVRKFIHGTDSTRCLFFPCCSVSKSDRVSCPRTWIVSRQHVACC